MMQSVAPRASADLGRALATLLANEGSAAHAHVRALGSLAGAEAARNAADAVHHLCLVHGRHPGVVDHAAARTTHAAARVSMFALADAFAAERDLLARLVVAVGPVPSTPGQAASESTVGHQRYAIDMLAQSDRAGCALGAALALALDWQAVRPVLAAAAKRYGVTAERCTIADPADLIDSVCAACPTPATERAALFGAQQIVAQHRGLWDLLEARAKARGW